MTCGGLTGCVNQAQPYAPVESEQQNPPTPDPRSVPNRPDTTPTPRRTPRLRDPRGVGRTTCSARPGLLPAQTAHGLCQAVHARRPHVLVHFIERRPLLGQGRAGVSPEQPLGSRKPSETSSAPHPLTECGALSVGGGVDGTPALLSRLFHSALQVAPKSRQVETEGIVAAVADDAGHEQALLVLGGVVAAVPHNCRHFVGKFTFSYRATRYDASTAISTGRRLYGKHDT